MRKNLQSTLIVAVASLMSHVAFGKLLDSQINKSKFGEGQNVSKSLIRGKEDAKIEANEGILIIKDQESDIKLLNDPRVLKNKGHTSGRSKAEDLDWGSYSENGVRGS